MPAAMQFQVPQLQPHMSHSPLQYTSTLTTSAWTYACCPHRSAPTSDPIHPHFDSVASPSTARPHYNLGLTSHACYITTPLTHLATSDPPTGCCAQAPLLSLLNQYQLTMKTIPQFPPRQHPPCLPFLPQHHRLLHRLHRRHSPPHSARLQMPLQSQPHPLAPRIPLQFCWRSHNIQPHDSPNTPTKAKATTSRPPSINVTVPAHILPHVRPPLRRQHNVPPDLHSPATHHHFQEFCQPRSDSWSTPTPSSQASRHLTLHPCEEFGQSLPTPSTTSTHSQSQAFRHAYIHSQTFRHRGCPPPISHPLPPKAVKPPELEDPLRRPPSPYTTTDRNVAKQTYGTSAHKRILHFLHHQCDQLAPPNSTMLEYVAKVLTNAGIKAIDLKDLEEWTPFDWEADVNDYTNTKYFSLSTFHDSKTRTVRNFPPLPRISYCSPRARHSTRSISHRSSTSSRHPS